MSESDEMCTVDFSDEISFFFYWKNFAAKIDKTDKIGVKLDV